MGEAGFGMMAFLSIQPGWAARWMRPVDMLPDSPATVGGALRGGANFGGKLCGDGSRWASRWQAGGASARSAIAPDVLEGRRMSWWGRRVSWWLQDVLVARGGCPGGRVLCPGGLGRVLAPWGDVLGTGSGVLEGWKMSWAGGLGTERPRPGLRAPISHRPRRSPCRDSSPTPT
jgi:hypothetical protein